MKFFIELAIIANVINTVIAQYNGHYEVAVISQLWVIIMLHCSKGAKA
jgi:hypothetical protein